MLERSIASNSVHPRSGDMSSTEPYAVEAHATTPGIREWQTLPALAEPLAGEALPAWLHQSAASLDLPPGKLFFDEHDAKRLADLAWWRHPETPFLARLAGRTGVALSVLQSMTFSDWTPYPEIDEVTGRFARQRVQRLSRQGVPTRRHSICSQCIASDPRPYVRKVWTLGWMAICETHKCMLVSRCSSCHAGYFMPPMRHESGYPPLSEHCRCGALIAEEGALAAHPLALRLQTALCASRMSGAFHWPGMPALSCTVLVPLIDLIVGLVWIGSRKEIRDTVLARIETELALSQRITGSPYDGLLLAAWVMSAWPDRAHALSADLKVQPLRGQLLFWDHLPHETREQLRQLVASTDGGA